MLINYIKRRICRYRFWTYCRSQSKEYTVDSVVTMLNYLSKISKDISYNRYDDIESPFATQSELLAAINALSKLVTSGESTDYTIRPIEVYPHLEWSIDSYDYSVPPSDTLKHVTRVVLNLATNLTPSLEEVVLRAHQPVWRAVDSYIRSTVLHYTPR